MENFASQNNFVVNEDTEVVPGRDRMRSVLKNTPFKKKQKQLFYHFMFLTQNLYEIQQTNSSQAKIANLFDSSDLYSDQLQVMYMQEQLISNQPQVQQYTDDVRRVNNLRHKSEATKPWSRSNRYLKTKLVEHLANDTKDIDIFSHTFLNREISQEASFQLQAKADACAQDVIFDSFLLSDFLTFGKTSSQSRQLLYLLDGIVLLPALVFTNKFGLNADFDVLKAVFDLEFTGVLAAILIASTGFLLRPVVISEIHMTYYRKQLSEANKCNFITLVIGTPVLVALLILGLAGASASVEIPFTSCL